MIKTWSTPLRHEKRREEPCALCGGRDFSARLRCEGFGYVRCKQCSLVQMNPQPDAEAVKRRYSGDDYLEYEIANEKTFLELEMLALADAGFYQFESGLDLSGRRALDIGCATGALPAKLRERGWQAEGVEINGRQADYARRTRGLLVYERPLEENRLTAGAYTLITASHLIEHLRRPRVFLAEARRLLAAEGRLFLTTPNIDGFQARLFGSRWRSAIFDHLYLFSAKTLTRLLEQEGFLIEKIVTWGGLAAGSAPRPVKFVFDKLAKRLGFGDVMLIRSTGL
ncbi:MAG: class I SAM-dependent methyltransferase [Spirochaetaceae bacterium]|jgi:2-polyprenyl-3-methyl-5-hydroxy-6-metoxy-1,4-benzoquinol methylase|nr:class I SAM-dependent methyltransferase [Spirochaetaceae bacterium]